MKIPGRVALRTAFALAIALARTSEAAPPTAARDAQVEAAVAKVAPAMVEMRHDLHQNPELANRETKTAEKVK